MTKPKPQLQLPQGKACRGWYTMELLVRPPLTHSAYSHSFMAAMESGEELSEEVEVMDPLAANMYSRAGHGSGKHQHNGHSTKVTRGLDRTKVSIQHQHLMHIVPLPPFPLSCSKAWSLAKLSARTALPVASTLSTPPSSPTPTLERSTLQARPSPHAMLPPCAVLWTAWPVARLLLVVWLADVRKHVTVAR